MSFQKSWLTNPVSIMEDPVEKLKKFVLEPDLPELHDPKPYYHPAKIDITKLYYVPTSPASTTIVPLRDTFGNIIEFVEIAVAGAGSTAKNSMSLQRAPGPREQETRGSRVNYPFWPGGFDEPEKDIMELEIDNYDFENNLLTVAPGLDEGMTFKGSQRQQGDIIDLLSVIEDEENVLGDHDQTSKTVKDEERSSETLAGLEEDDELLAIPQPKILKISEANESKSIKTEYAESIDLSKPVKDFDLKVPDPAHKFPFKLDNFQKQAIIKLEEHCHVFVAAHTSAGKTVVAEYAIALSKKNMTRTIYTSPIKALSNQKYHDFKQKFKDVGLITGDIQIDSGSSCLIMTTEILRSMLYCGSEVTRDLEFVIFDEVHYLNDPDRGHVWEEVLILLPDHVCIVMLSASVPNTITFASWVGRTKKKKVYVMTTQKRPVPLEHHLYTGFGGKTRNDIFKIVDATSTFSVKAYEMAKNSKLDKQKDMQKTYNVIKSQKPFTIEQEKTLWVGLIDYLRRNQKMPVIAFILSRNRCDNLAKALIAVDLCTGSEKYKINATFQKCLQRLKPTDRILPQVVQLQKCLNQGIGIHHSGILPILKEVVEILFEKGLVKLLFATETFAMGVNMPAKTVIFDSVKKFTGKENRFLNPAEYMQMAGRAGRRGIDTSGTVIIICKKEIPEVEKLREMILGKPMKLESQFRLTYSMILNLLRVETLTVEDIMSHSYLEFPNQSRVPEVEEKLKAVTEKLSKVQDLGEHMKSLCDFYDATNNYIQKWNEVAPQYILQQNVQNEMKPGCILIISYKSHYNKLALLLSVPRTVTVNSQYEVLVLLNKNNSIDDKSEQYHTMISFSAANKYFYPDGLGGHEVISIQAKNILIVSKVALKLDCTALLNNWKDRQMPRFKDSPPSSNFLKAIAELKNLTDEYNNNPAIISAVEISNMPSDLFESCKLLNTLKQEIIKTQPLTDVPNFENEFYQVFERKHLENAFKQCKFELSSESMTLHSDYCNKIEVLHRLGYIDNSQQVTLKGRVACEMSQNELIITQLLFEFNIIDLEPAEIVALLSSIIFQERKQKEDGEERVPELPENLNLAKKKLMEIDNDIMRIEEECRVFDAEEVKGDDRLNFALMEVVYQWARNKPFAEIMELTDVKEGIIVRCIQQLNEILKDLKDAARIIGNSALQRKMEEASNAIKRDIVFAASLYTTDDNIFVETE